MTAASSTTTTRPRTGDCRGHGRAGWKGNELTVDRDIMVLANPEIASLPNWVIALVAAGGLAAALSTAAGLLLAISSSISHDLLKSVLMPNISEKTGAAGGAHRHRRGDRRRRLSSASTRRASWRRWWPSPSAWRPRRCSRPSCSASSTSGRTMEGAIAGMLAGIVFTLELHHLLQVSCCRRPAGPDTSGGWASRPRASAPSACC